MNVHDLFPSKYLKASDFQGQDVTLMMVTVAVEDIGDGENRPLLRFDGAKKGLLLNRTNARTIAELYGAETNDWRGRHVTLFPTTTDFRGASVDCIRVRPTAPVRSEPLDDFGKPEAVLPRREMAVPSGNGVGLDL
jgi:hypothetical protein